jgi:DNA-binding response OmpR family regulator
LATDEITPLSVEEIMARILIVDDEEEMLKSIKLTLEGLGHECLFASDGLEALDKARKWSPDLIILDIMLPGLDGFQVSRYLKFDSKFRHIPIIMLTAKSDEKDKALGFEAGTNEYLTKPFTLEEFMGVVSRYVSINAS